MLDFSALGRILLVIGLILAGLGILLVLAAKLHLPWIGRLPGDFLFRGRNVTFYFPLATSLIVSIILSLILWLVNRR
ncbi:MAG: DUF2905 domain-containing protein [Deltaproteobacteria bacterium]|nr:DUF2905 domain-containing protein [Deltaproteobacteria bacterium]